MHRPPPIHHFAQRLLAGLGVGLVLMLGALAVNPEWHTWIHTTDHVSKETADTHHSGKQAPVDNLCVVDLYAHATALTTAPLILPAPAQRWVVPVYRTEARIAATTPDHLRPPGRAPPFLS